MSHNDKLVKAIDDNILKVISKTDLTRIRNSSIFITGGTGFVGFWILSALRYMNNNGFNIKVRVLSRDPSRFISRFPHFSNISWLHFISGDIESYEFPIEKFDYLIHAATDTSFEASKKPIYLLNNMLNGIRRVYEHAKHSKIDRVLLLSSGAVYGQIPENILSVEENMNFSSENLDINGVYYEGKRITELFGQLYHDQYGIDSVIARCFSFSGFGLPKHLALNQFLYQALNEDKIVIIGSGKPLRSYLYAADLSVWLLTILAQGKSNQIYNVGSDKAYSILELANLVRNEFAPRKEIIVIGSKDKTERMNYIPSINKAKSIGLDVWFSLQESLIEWQVQENFL
jgi:nucleoside-diphosphate-sugar epimerase